MKICTKCRSEKDELEFNKKAADKLHSYCKVCQAAYTHQHYLINKDKYNKKSLKTKKRRYLETKEWVNSFKNIPCTDCNVRYPPHVMDFDHIRGKKIKSISKLMIGCYSRNVILEEMAKCELVCANCHRIRTHERLEE